MRANRCEERTRLSARRTTDASVRVRRRGNRIVRGCGYRGNRRAGHRAQAGTAPVEQHVVGGEQAAGAGAHAGPAEQADAAAAAAADQFQVAGGVADHVHGAAGVVGRLVAQGLGVVVVDGRQPAVQPQGVADDQLHRDRGHVVRRRRLRQATDARAAAAVAAAAAGGRRRDATDAGVGGRRRVDGDDQQTGAAGAASPGAVEETESAAGTVHAAATVATHAAAARPAAAEEDGQRGQPAAENGPVHERGRAHIGLAHPAGRRGAIIGGRRRRRRRRTATSAAKRRDHDGRRQDRDRGEQSVRDGHHMTHDGRLKRLTARSSRVYNRGYGYHRDRQ